MHAVRLFLGAIGVLALTTSARAQTSPHQNGAPDGIGGASITNPYRVVDDFTFTSLTIIDGIRFWNLQETAFNVAGFEWSISMDAGGAPGLAVAGGTFTPAVRLAQGLAGSGLLYQNDLFIGTQTLAPGTYWLNLRDNAGPPDIFWATTSSQAGYFAQYGQDNPPPNPDDPNNPNLPIQYVSLDTDLAFDLTLTPEPATVLLVATGLLALGMVPRRSRNRQNQL